MRLFNDEQEQFLLTVLKGHKNQEIAELINAKYGTAVTREQIMHYKAKHGLNSFGQTNKKITTPEIEQFITDNVKGLTNKELIALVKEKMGREYTLEQIKAIKLRLGLRSGLENYFVKGKPSRNKGKKLPKNVYDALKPTMFKKGQPPPNKQQVGYERMTKDGYTMVKTETGFRLKQILVYEAAHGPVPKGYKLMFADGNRQNFDLDNLVLVTHGELVTLAIKGLISDIPEITKANLARVRLMRTIKERRKGIEK